MKTYSRESVYLSENEQAALEQLAHSFNTSKNAVIKILIRDAAGMPLPQEYLDKLREKVTLLSGEK